MLVTVVLATGHPPVLTARWLVRNGIEVRKGIYLLNMPQADIASTLTQGATAYYADKNAPFRIGYLGEPGPLARLCSFI